MSKNCKGRWQAKNNKSLLIQFYQLSFPTGVNARLGHISIKIL